eukprot:3341539-Pyramimonas_sp.AAC.1
MMDVPKMRNEKLMDPPTGTSGGAPREACECFRSVLEQDGEAHVDPATGAAVKPPMGYETPRCVEACGSGPSADPPPTGHTWTLPLGPSVELPLDYCAGLGRRMWTLPVGPSVQLPHGPRHSALGG